MCFMADKERFTFKQFVQMENFWKRMAIMLPSVFFMGFLLSFLIEVGWGTDPASYFLLHFSNFINLSFGNTQVIVYTCMFVLVFFLGPKYIGFGTLSNMILIGYISDFFRFIWNKIGYSQLIDSNFSIQIITFIFALIVFVISAAFYINSKTGVAPYDALPQIISDALPKLPFAPLRIAFDLSFVFLGFLFGITSPEGLQGSVIGAVALSLLIGPAISLVGNWIKKLI